MVTTRDDDYVRLNYISDFIEEFVLTSRKERLHYLLSKPKRRHEIPGCFYTDEYLDRRYIHPLATTEQSAGAIYQRMRAMGAPDECFVLSMEDEYKDQVNLRNTLDEFVGLFGGIVLLYCREARLAYWQGDRGECCLLYKKKS